MKTKTILITLIIAVSIFTCNTPYVSAQWVAQTAPSADTLVSVSFADINNGYAIGASEFNPFSKVLKTTNGGLNWSIENSNSFLLCVHFIDLNNGYMGCDDTIFKTTNAGLTWTAYPLGLGASNYVVNIYFFNSNVGFASVGNYNTNTMTMVYTSNGGNTWMASSSPGIAAGAGNNNIFCTSATTCYAVGWNGQTPGIIKTTDGGITWNNILNLNADLASVFFISSTTGFASGGGGGSGGAGIHKTTDSGVSWNQVVSFPWGFISSIYFTDPNTGYAAGSNLGGGNTVLQTTDGGNTWNLMTTPTNSNLNAIDFPDANTGYAVGRAGTILKYEVPIGIGEAYSESSILIYPNPASDLITVSIPDKNTIDLTINIYNAIGELIKTKALKQNQNEIDIWDLNNGIYFVEVKSVDWSGTKKLIIQK